MPFSFLINAFTAPNRFYSCPWEERNKCSRGLCETPNERELKQNVDSVDITVMKRST